MKLWKTVLLPAVGALLLNAAACTEDKIKITKQQAIEVVENQLVQRKFGFVEELERRSINGELTKQQEDALSSRVDYFIATNDIGPLEDAFERASEKGDSTFTRLKKSLRPDSLALEAVKAGYFTLERNPKQGFKLIVNVPNSPLGPANTKVYEFILDDDVNDNP